MDLFPNNLRYENKSNMRNITIHNELKKNFRWYNKWHENPGHHFVHWLLLLLIILPITLAIGTDIELTYSSENYMFALQHDGAQDSASTTRPLTTEEQITALPNCVPDAVLTTIELPILCDFAPSKIRPGGQITAVGVNLSSTGNLSNTQGSVIPLSGSLVKKTDARGRTLDYVTFTVPGSLKDGSYSLEVINGISSAVTTKVLMVSSTGTVQQPKIIRHLTFPRSIVPPLLGTTNLGELIGNIFNFSIQILGLIIFVIIVISGFQWLTAGGNVGTISKAQSRITQALLGAIILLASFLILKTINPDLIKGGSTLETINVPKGETIITEQEINPSLPQCNPACPTGQLCVIDSATNTASCRTNPGLLGNCDPMNPNSCPSGQTCQLDLSTSTATCR